MFTPSQTAELRSLGLRCAHPRISRVQQGIANGTSWAELAEREGTTIECLKGWAYEFQRAVKGEIPLATHSAYNLAQVIRHLDPVMMTAGTRAAWEQYIEGLHRVNREIPKRPAQQGVLGAHTRKPEDRHHATCPKCFIQHHASEEC